MDTTGFDALQCSMLMRLLKRVSSLYSAEKIKFNEVCSTFMPLFGVRVNVGLFFTHFHP